MKGEFHQEIQAAVAAMCSDVVAGTSGRIQFDQELWSKLSVNGFTLMGLGSELGGSGGDCTDAATALRTASVQLVNVPLAETTFVATWLLGAVGFPAPGVGPLGVTTDVLSIVHDATGSWITGTASVAWGRDCEHLVSLVEDAGNLFVTVLPLSSEALEAGCIDVERFENLAGEPRDILTFTRMPCPDLLKSTPPQVNPDTVLARGALARSVQLAGAAEAILSMSLRHASGREQFGRALSKFQSVQQQLATLAAEVAAMRVASDAALLAVASGSRSADFAIAAAKAYTSSQTQVVTAIAHQIHGAMGYSREHMLGAATTRMWSWRDEYGNDSFWHDRLAEMALEPSSWWQAVTT